MKKTILSLCCAAFLVTLQAQQTGKTNFPVMTDRELGEFYWQKGKNQKTTAWILVAGSALLTVVGTSMYWQGFWEDNNSAKTGEILTFGGAILSSVSIPLFISAARNKRRAEILLRRENVPLGMNPKKAITAGVAIPLVR